MSEPTDAEFARFVWPELDLAEQSPPPETECQGGPIDLSAIALNDPQCLFSPAVPEMLAVRDVLALLKISRSTLYAWLEQGHFPPPVRCGSSSVRWFEDEVLEWQRELPRASYGDSAGE